MNWPEIIGKLKCIRISIVSFVQNWIRRLLPPRTAPPATWETINFDSICESIQLTRRLSNLFSHESIYEMSDQVQQQNMATKHQIIEREKMRWGWGGTNEDQSPSDHSHFTHKLNF